MLLLSFVKGLYFLSTTSLGKLQTAFVFGKNAELCAAFLILNISVSCQNARIREHCQGKLIHLDNSSCIFLVMHSFIFSDVVRLIREPRQKNSSPRMWE
ncbi:hypothetical protein Bca4012_072604 [Brassica carinata]|uniref:(rape) hypothetical protein n=1 Tax=Brassica napus TaxID=3708 RepID=A0A078G8A4_BRANA|nr:unnamed protein product [Brassica napus]CDY20883.1 BnaC05g26090D [Brassica napus]